MQNFPANQFYSDVKSGKYLKKDHSDFKISYNR